MNEKAKKERASRKFGKFFALSTAKETAYLALGVAILTACAWITIPYGLIPVTLQTFAVALVGVLFGTVRGSIVVAVYLLMGIVGIPVFSGFKGGVVALTGPTGGYLIGFLFSVAITGLFSLIKIKRKIAKIAVVYFGALLALAVCYFFGTLFFVEVYSARVKPVGVLSALSLCVLPYLLPDAIKLFFGVLLGVKLQKVVAFRQRK